MDTADTPPPEPDAPQDSAPQLAEKTVQLSPDPPATPPPGAGEKPPVSAAIKHTVHGVLAILVVALAIGGAKFASENVPAPDTEAKPTPPRVVEAVPAVRGDYPVTLTGYGTVESAQTLQVSPQVGGRAISVHPDLEVGVVIPAGTELFRLESRDFELQIELNEAEGRRIDAEVARLLQEVRNAQSSLTLRRQQLGLSERERDRLADLAKQDGIVTATAVDQAERQVLADREAIQSLENTLETLPLQIKSLTVQRERLDKSSDLQRLNVDRCVVTMPFTGRVMEAMLEAGQVLAPNQVVATIVDDSQLQIDVPLEAREVRQYLPFDTAAATDGWFPPPRPIVGQVRWLDDPAATPWPCHVQRISSYDRSTRTVRLLVTLDPAAPGADPATQPVSGMFCSVAIPGEQMHDVVVLPRAALRTGSQVYVVADGRLDFRDVTLLREAEDTVVLRGDIPADAMVVTSKLGTPLDGMAVTIRGQEPTAPSASTDTSPAAGEPQAAADPDDAPREGEPRS